MQCSAASGAISQNVPLVDDLVLKEIAWQFPPVQGVNPCQLVFGIDNCQRSPREACQGIEIEIEAGDADMAPSFAVTDPNSVQIEGESKSHNENRPFLSLSLPEWVHEKAVEDEVAGIFRCKSLASFASSPTSSAASSPASSRTSSPVLPSKEDFAPKPTEAKVRSRSGVSWADLAESEDDDLVEYATSVASTATSSPALYYSSAPKDVDSEPAVYLCSEEYDEDKMPEVAAFALSSTPSCTCSPVSSLKDDFAPRPTEAKVRSRSGVSWADLAESEDEDMIEYAWYAASAASTATSSPALYYSSAPKDVDSESMVYLCSEEEDEATMSEVAAVNHFTGFFRLRDADSASITSQDFFVVGAEEPQVALAQSVTPSGAAANAIRSGGRQPIQFHTQTGSCHHFSGISWVDLVESDCDPLNYPWSSTEGACSLVASSNRQLSQNLPLAEVENSTGDHCENEPAEPGATFWESREALRLNTCRREAKLKQAGHLMSAPISVCTSCSRREEGDVKNPQCNSWGTSGGKAGSMSAAGRASRKTARARMGRQPRVNTLCG
jgi:hypothetical protein